MSTITKERLQRLIRAIDSGNYDEEEIVGWVNSDEILEMARIALASLEAEPVAYMYKDNLHSDARFSLHTRFGNWSQEDINEYEITEIPLYTAPPALVSLDAGDKLSNFIASQELLGKDFEKVLAENIEGLYVPGNSAPPAPAHAEPVAWLWSHRKHPSEVTLVRHEDDERAEVAHWSGWSCQALYAAPPEPVSVPDEVLKRLLPDAEKAEFWFEHDGKILFEGVKFNNAVFEACRAAMLQGAEPVTTAYKLRDAVDIIRNSGIAIDAKKILAERDALNSPGCWCRICRPITLTDMRFVVCPECGNKRCPHANDHRNACTGSNEPGQEGSAYPEAPQQEVKP